MRCVSGIVPTAPSPTGCKRRRVHTGLLFCLPPGDAELGQADVFAVTAEKSSEAATKNATGYEYTDVDGGVGSVRQVPAPRSAA